MNDETPSPANTLQIGGTHYKDNQYEPWDVIMDWDLGYLDGTVVKYLSRWQKKGTPLQDLLKASHYLQKLIERETASAKTHAEAQGDILELEKIARKLTPDNPSNLNPPPLIGATAPAFLKRDKT